jgi:non-heme chloroperoxidase
MAAPPDEEPPSGRLRFARPDANAQSLQAGANASFKQQQNEGVTEITEIKGRGHALTIDSGWREVADTALAFVKRFTGNRQ